MRRVALALGLALALVIPLPAIAADLHEPHKGTACASDEVGVWHFVNNQTRGADAGVLSVTFDGGAPVDYGPTKVLRNVQHFWVPETGYVGQVLTDATTNLPGRLVLSEYSCVKK